MTPSPNLGVIIVTYNASDVILPCLESLFGADRASSLAVVVVDNASSDGTAELIERWARGAGASVEQALGPVQPRPVSKPLSLATIGPGETAQGQLTLLRSTVNGGYAYGVNRGLDALRGRADIAAYWVLNPDCVVPPDTPGRLLDFVRDTEFGLAGGRCRFFEAPDIIQTDGGLVSRSTGVCGSIHAGQSAALTPMPRDAELDYVSGAHFLIARDYLEQVGPMSEDYFLYYEEVDWAFRRGAFPLKAIPEADIFHRAGASIGSGGFKRPPSPFSFYFNHRNRMWFVKKHLKGRSLSALAWSLAKCLQLLLKVGRAESYALLKGAMGWAPPRRIRDAVDPDARHLAFPERPGSGG